MPPEIHSDPAMPTSLASPSERVRVNYSHDSFVVEIYIDHSTLPFEALRPGPGLSSVQRLTLVRMPPAAGKELVSLYQAFSGVTELFIDRCCHGYHPSISAERPVMIFPLLQTVQVPCWDDFSMFVGSLFNFLECRARIGSPVLLLNLGGGFNEGFTEDQEIRLHQIDGLVMGPLPVRLGRSRYHRLQLGYKDNINNLPGEFLLNYNSQTHILAWPTFLPNVSVAYSQRPYLLGTHSVFFATYMCCIRHFRLLPSLKYVG
ncbi:hypothetical protein CPC08DRAFT_445734 [Agrocybe pediades]|nr:hypothetical protein CPC08DRAFT_445734 [Agrocybe pediades]